MNVKDFDIEIPPGDMMQTIFSHQRSLMDKYHSIEEKNVGQPVPSAPSQYGPHSGALDIQDRACQLHLKSFAWRITEELTEATLCLDGTPHFDEVHYLEEIVDALHFSIELYAMSGCDTEGRIGVDTLEFMFHASNVDPVDLRYNGGQEKMRSIVYTCIEKLGEGMNRLKLKPWKTTAQLTDIELYKGSITQFLLRFIDVAKASGFTARTLCAMYLNKNAVNQFRIRTNY